MEPLARVIFGTKQVPTRTKIPDLLVQCGSTIGSIWNQNSSNRNQSFQICWFHMEPKSVPFGTKKVPIGTKVLRFLVQYGTKVGSTPCPPDRTLFGSILEPMTIGNQNITMEQSY